MTAAHDLTLVIVGKDQKSLDDPYFGLHDLPAAELVLMANTSNESLAAIGNRYLDACQTPIFGLAHADCLFRAGSLDAFTEAARTTVCGIVGIAKDDVYHWCFEKPYPRPVMTLDSCSIFFSRDSGLRFDAQTFDGMHCHVQDVCLTAHHRGLPVVVPSADATHRGVNFAEPAWRADYKIYIGRLHAKWRQWFPVIKMT